MHRNRHRATVVALVVAMILPAAHVSAPRAAAVSPVTNVIATTEIGEPLDEGVTTLSDNDNLWAYVTAPLGGPICVVGYTAPGPIVGGSFECPGGGWGMGFAPPFFAGLVPVAPAPLRSGTWVLVATSRDILGNPFISAVGQPFLITHCTGSCPPAPPPDPSQAKAVFSAIASSIYNICQGAKALNFMHKLAEFKNSYDTMVVSPSGAGLGTFVVSVATDVAKSAVIGGLTPKPVAYLPANVGIGLWALCKSFFGADFPNNPIPFTSGPGVNVPGPAGAVNAWLNDPPQPYETVAVADPIDWTQIDFTGFHPDALDLALPVDQLRAYLAAGTTSYERFMAAHADGPAAVTFAHDQAAAVALNFDGVRAALAATSTEIDILIAEILADPMWLDTISQADIDAVAPLLRRIRDTGFSAAEISDFHAAGLSDGMIAQLRDQLGGDPDALVGPLSFHGALGKLRDDLRNAIPAVDQFATQAAYYAANTTGPNRAPVASFTTTPSTGAAPLPVSFDASASSDPDDDPLAYAWSFGDGIVASGPTVQHVYAGAGTYVASLTVSDGAHSSTTTQSVVVTGNHAPIAGADLNVTFPNTAVTTSVLSNDSDADFDALSITGWTQGSGGSVSCSGGACTYTPGAVIGTDIFRYTISDGHGGVATGIVKITINPSGPPSADFSVTPQSGPGPLSTVLDGSLSADPGGAVVEWAWDLGDGTTATGPSVAHTFPTGTYRVTLQVTDNDGEVSSVVSRLVQATDGGNVVPIIESVTAQPASGVAPLVVNFSLGSFDPDGTIVSRTWDFGDGATGSGAAPSHTYATAGSYQATVTVTDDDGGSESANVAVTVYPPANQSPVVVDESQTVFKGQTLDLNVLANDSDPDGDPISITDTFGPLFGTGGCDASGDCTYTPGIGFLGQDAIRYVVDDGRGGTRQGIVHITVARQPGAPTAVPGVSPANGITPLESSLNGLASTDPDGTIVSYEWSIQGVPAATGALANFEFGDPGTIDVALTVVDDDGLSDTVLTTARIRDLELLSVPFCGDADEGNLTPSCLEYELDPSVQLYQVGGTGSVPITFDTIVRNAGLQNELATFVVDDAAGTIDGLFPGDPGYYEALLERAEMLFPANGTSSHPDVVRFFPAGTVFGFVLFPRTTLEEARTTPDWQDEAFFSIDALNTDNTDHLLAFRHQDGSTFEFGLEDLPGGGDLDYDDIVYTVRGQLDGVPQVVVSKTVDRPVSAAGESVGYSIVVANTASHTVIVDAVVDTLPAGFVYEPGSTDGATSAEPTIDGRTLTWDGPFIVESLETLTIDFDAVAAATPGLYTNEATADAGPIEVQATGPTAPVLVVTALPDGLPPIVDAGPDRDGLVGALIDLDGTVLDAEGLPHPTGWSYLPLSGVAPGATCAFEDVTAVDTTISCTHRGSYRVTLTADPLGTPIADSATIRINPTGDSALALDPVPDKVANEGTLLDFDVTGRGPSGTVLEFGLDGCPAASTIDSATGAFLWLPTESDGPGAYDCSVVLTSSGEEVRDTFKITIAEVNLDPELTAPADVTVEAGQTATGQATASDTDIPANALTYELVTSPGSIGPTSGAFSWLTSLADVGDRLITLRVNDGAGGTDTATFVVHVTAPPRATTNLQLGGDALGQYSDHATLSARLTSNGSAVSGASVILTLGGVSHTATTDADGWASSEFVVPGPAGAIARSASFPGNVGLQSSEVSGSFSVLREDAALQLLGGDAVAAGSTVTLRVVVSDSAAIGYGGADPESSPTATIGDVSRMSVAFEVYAAGSCLTGTPIRTFTANVVDESPTGDGVGAATASWPSVPEGAYCITTRLIGATIGTANDWYVAAPAQPIGLGVFRPATGHVTGGGWTTLASGERATFGFNAISDKKGVKGQLVFVAHVDCGSEPSRLLVKSNAMSGISSDGQVDPATAILSGKAVLRCTALDDGATLWERGNASWRATVVDGGRRTTDSFGLRVTDSAGQGVLDLAPATLRGGSIVAHLR